MWASSYATVAIAGTVIATVGTITAGSAKTATGTSDVPHNNTMTADVGSAGGAT